MSRERRREMVGREQLVQLILLPQGKFLGEPGRDVGDRPAISDHAILRVAADGGLAAETGLPGQQKTGPAFHGTCGHLPAAQEQQAGARAQGVSLSVGRPGNHSTQPGEGGGYHLHTHGQRLPVPGGHHELA